MKIKLATMRRKYRIAVVEDGYVAEIRKFGRWEPLYGGSRWGSVGGALTEAEDRIQRHLKSYPPRSGYVVFRQRAYWESEDSTHPPATILKLNGTAFRPKAGELAQRIHDLVMEYEGEIGQAEAIGALEITKHTLLSGELISKLSE
ncbi:hypothetical protein [Bacillus altitudinis]|uniref:hypothetical protein n=1 Tax=Bacillus altitudinis TaxID=293387 RepID=UPI00366DCA3A